MDTAATEHLKYVVAIQESEEGFCVWVPALPGCVSQGATEEEAIGNISDAIREYIEVLQENARSENVRIVEIAV